MNIFDGKLDPSSYSTGIRQAIAAKVDGLILDAIDCSLVKQALVEARAAKVKRSPTTLSIVMTLR